MRKNRSIIDLSIIYDTMIYLFALRDTKEESSDREAFQPKFESRIPELVLLDLKSRS